MSLAARLEAIREGAKERIPKEVLAQMHKATEELRLSGIIDDALGAGERMPSFSLADDNGKQVNSSELLGIGPLVLTFYRGSW